MNAAVTPRPARVIVAVLLAAVLGAVAVLAGCTPSNVVASVDGRVVLTAERLARLEPLVLEQLEAQGQGAPAVITVVVTGELAPAIATAKGVELTPDQLAYVEELSAKASDPETKEVIRKFYTAFMIFQTVNQQNPNMWADEVGLVPVQVNPRWGSWVRVENPTGDTWGVVQSGSLSQPFATAPTVQG